MSEKAVHGDVAGDLWISKLTEEANMKRLQNSQLPFTELGLFCVNMALSFSLKDKWVIFTDVTKTH